MKRKKGLILNIQKKGFLAPLTAVAETEGLPTISKQWVKQTFLNIDQVFQMNKQVYDMIHIRLANWSDNQRIGDIFMKMVSLSFPLPSSPFLFPLPLSFSPFFDCYFSIWDPAQRLLTKGQGYPGGMIVFNNMCKLNAFFSTPFPLLYSNLILLSYSSLPLLPFITSFPSFPSSPSPLPLLPLFPLPPSIPLFPSLSYPPSPSTLSLLLFLCFLLPLSASNLLLLLYPFPYPYSLLSFFPLLLFSSSLFSSFSSIFLPSSSLSVPRTPFVKLYSPIFLLPTSLVTPFPLPPSTFRLLYHFPYFKIWENEREKWECEFLIEHKKSYRF